MYRGGETLCVSIAGMCFFFGRLDGPTLPSLPAAALFASPG